MARKKPEAPDSKPRASEKPARPSPEVSRLTLRPATLADAELLLMWRNDGETRRQSRSTARVPAPDHLRWLSAILADPEIRLFIARDEHGEEIGTGRLDYRGQGMAELNLTVAPGCRGRGLAGPIIEALSDEANRLGWSQHIARVNGTNVPSLRAFLRAGFIPDACIHFERRP